MSRWSLVSAVTFGVLLVAGFVAIFLPQFTSADPLARQQLRSAIVVGRDVATCGPWASVSWYGDEVRYFANTSCDGLTPVDVAVAVRVGDDHVHESECQDNEPLFFTCGAKEVTGTVACPEGNCQGMTVTVSHRIDLDESASLPSLADVDGALCILEENSLRCTYELTSGTVTVEDVHRSRQGDVVACITSPSEPTETVLADFSFDPEVDRVLLATEQGLFEVEPSADAVLARLEDIGAPPPPEDAGTDPC